MSVLSETEVKEWLLNAWEQIIGTMAKDSDPDMDILVDSNIGLTLMNSLILSGTRTNGFHS